MAGLFDQLAQGLGGMSQQGGGIDFQSLVKAVPPELLTQAAGAALRQVPGQEYHDHAEPGVGGTDPIGALGPQLITAIAQALVSALMSRGVSQSQIQSVPNVGTTRPETMTSFDLSSLAQWAQQQHPDALAEVIAQFKDQPDVVQSLLGNQALQQTVMQLGSQFLRDHTQGR